MVVKALVWDLDGTLIHFKIDFIRARKAAIKILNGNGVPKDLLTIENSILDTIKKSKEFFESSEYEHKKVKNIINNVNRAVVAVEYEAAINAKIIEDIDKVLEFAKESNLKQAIYTYNTNENAKISLKTVNILTYFDIIVGRDDVENPKPHPEHLNHICERLNVDPADVIVIGDTYRDIEGAINVGAHSIAIHSKFFNHSKKSQIMHKADEIIKENNVAFKLIKTIQKFL